MALQLNYVSEFGITCASSYWRVSLATLSVPQRILSFLVDCYKDADAAQSNKKPLKTRSYNCTDDDFDVYALVNDNIRKNAYNYLKARVAFFASATDV